MMTVIDRFLRDVKENNAENTYINYKIDLNQFKDWVLAAKGINNVNEAIKETTFDDIDDYKHYLRENFEKSSINRKIMALKSFFAFAKNSLRMAENPTEGIKGFKLTNKEESTCISVDVVKKIIELTRIRESNERNFLFNSKRNRFLIAFLTTCGLRIEEALGIKFKDIKECEGGEYYMVDIKASDVKNNLNKRVPIANKTLEYYRDYLAELKKISDCKDDDYLIISSRGKKLTTKASNDMVKKYMNRIDDSINITNHTFRHTCNNKLVADGVSSILIDDLLGWKGSGMSATVYFHNNTVELDRKKVQITNFL